MNVVHVIPSLAARTGGPAVSVVETSLALEDSGIRSSIFTTEMAAAASAPHRRAATAADLVRGAESADVRLFPVQHPHRLAYSPSLERALAAAVPAADVVHVHSLFLFPQFAAFRQAARADVPYVVSPRGSLDPYLRAHGRLRKRVVDLLWQRRMLEGAAAIHATSDEEARLFADVAPRVPRLVVPNGIRWAEYQHLPSSTHFRRRHLGGHEGPLVLFLGRISFKKGLDVLIRALALAAREVAGVRLAIVGPDDEQLVPSLERVARREGVADRVVFPGMVGAAERREALAAADVWALPSHTENFAVALVEALAAGRPVVVSPAVNIAAEIESDGAGVVGPAEPAPFAEALVELLLDAERRALLGERARSFARRFDWSQVAPRLAAMYAEVAR